MRELGRENCVRENRLINWNGTTISYDANGNMLSDGDHTFTWDNRDQVSSVNGIGLQYDGFGRRSANLFGTAFLYSGRNAVQELLGGTVIANSITGRVDEVFNRSDSSGTYTPLQDGNGNVIALVNSSGSIVTSYSYDPFGNTSSSGAGSTNPSQYTGRENETNGLYFYRHRYYSPVLGRFVSEDPLRFESGQDDFYVYVSDNPVNSKDPSGLKVYRCHRPTHFDGNWAWANSLGLTHDWLRTDTVEAGLGPAGRGVPGGGQPDGIGVPTAVVDHSGESLEPGASCEEVPDEDEACVNEELTIGKPKGPFIPGLNDCKVFATNVLNRCNKDAYANSHALPPGIGWF